MVKNTKGGTGHKKSKNKPLMAVRKLEDIAKNPDSAECESYGVITAAMGNRRFMIRCQDLSDPKVLRELNCSLRGSHRKKVFTGDYVLVKIFDFNTDQGIIIDAYREGEVDSMIRAGLWDFPEDGAKQIIKPMKTQKDVPAKIVNESESESESESSGSDIETIAQAVRKPDLPSDFDIDTI